VKNLRLALLAAATLLAATACADPLASPAGDVGTLSLSYSGAEAGSVDIRGARAPDDGSSYAAGARSSRGLFAMGVRVAQGPRRDVVTLRAGGNEPGSYEIGGDGPGAADAEIALEVASAGGEARARYLFTSGTLTVEPDRGDRRIRGTFTGTARRAGGTAEIQVTGGRFDVPDNLPRLGS
jgi:hypothetical protein